MEYMAAAALVSAQDGDRREEEGEQQPDSTSSSEVSRQNKVGESGSPVRPDHVPRLAVEQAGIADASQPVQSQGTSPPGSSPGSVVASAGFLHPADPPPAVHTPVHASGNDIEQDQRWTGQNSGGANGSYRGAIPFTSPASTSTGWEWQRTPGARSVAGDANGAGERQSHRRKLLELSEECRSLSRHDIQSRVASLQETYTPSLARNPEP